MWFAKLKVFGTSVRYGNGVHKGLTIESGLHTLKWWFVPNGKDLLFTPFSHDVIVTLHEKHQMVYMSSFDYNFYFWAFPYLLISFKYSCLFELVRLPEIKNILIEKIKNYILIWRATISYNTGFVSHLHQVSHGKETKMLTRNTGPRISSAPYSIGVGWN